MFTEFAFLTDTWRIIFQTIAYGSIALIYMLVALFFVRKSSKLLKDKQMWNSIVKWTFLACTIIFIISEVYCLTVIFVRKANVYNICLSFTDLLMQCNSTLAVGVFGGLSIFTGLRLGEQMAEDTLMAYKYHLKSKRRQILIMVAFITG